MQANLESEEKPLLNADKSLLKQLVKKDGAMALAVNNELIRRHFYLLTSTFLQPLGILQARSLAEKYWGQLVTSSLEFSPFKPPPKLKNFSEAEFLDQIRSSKQQLGQASSKKAEVCFLSP